MANPVQDRLWVVYCHVPGGQMCAMNFIEEERKRRVGDNQIETIIFPAMDQVRNFEKQDFVALNLKGTVTRNKVLVYEGGQDLRRNPHAADVVLEWARQKGVQPIESPQAQKDRAEKDRVLRLEQKIAELTGQIDMMSKVVAK